MYNGNTGFQKPRAGPGEGCHWHPGLAGTCPPDWARHQLQEEPGSPELWDLAGYPTWIMMYCPNQNRKFGRYYFF